MSNVTNRGPEIFYPFENFNLLSSDEEKQFFKHCENGDLENVKSLIERIDLEKADEIGRIPLHIACKKGHFEIAQLLISKMKNLDLFDMYGDSPLKQASKKGYLDIVTLLLDNGANIEAVDTNPASKPIENYESRTALHLACVEGHINLLLDRNANLEAITKHENQTPLHLACDAGHTDVVNLLLDRKANLEATTKHVSQTPLHLACRYGKPETVKQLVNRGANILAKDTNNQTPLEIAENNSFYSPEISFIIFEYGLKKGIYQPCDSPLLKAWEKGETYKTDSFIRAGFSIKDLITKNRTILDVFHECCKSGFFCSAIGCLTDGELKVNDTDDERNTPLHIATNFPRQNDKYANLLICLLSRGADPLKENSMSEKPKISRQFLSRLLKNSRG